MALTWKEQFNDKLSEHFGKKQGALLYEKYNDSFSKSYCDDYSPDMAVADIGYMETLSGDKTLDIHFYQSTDNTSQPLHLRLFQKQSAIPLCTILPMLENLDLMAYDETPHKVTLTNKQNILISDFSVAYNKGALDIEKIKDIFQDAFTSIFSESSENDGFNKLVLGANLPWREVMILRAYAKYMRQIGFRFTQPYIEKALIENTAIAGHLIQLFLTLHNPVNGNKSLATASLIEQQIIKALESVASLDEDIILRRYLNLIKATLRTNYFQVTASRQHKEYLALKFASSAIPDMPQPVPLYEIFIYSPRFEGIHLRSAKVARGGIRWSDRREDFRTEVLGLMKAQKVKNAVIVPSGAKGGFVLKALTAKANAEAIQTEVIYCYKSFIRGLLDLTDNIKNNKPMPPKQVVCYDDPDPYLVVAADKGTASFSDIANGISADYEFWLGDAFASGGSAGYDHKKMGITARGAWESIKRHFIELNINLAQHVIHVVGIGDMSGDVFGNGMLYTDRIKLVAAFDHRHIFIDPNPDPKESYKERRRLFQLPKSSWEDYNPKLISKGGGVFKRSDKSITLTAAMKAILGTEENSLSPNELIRAILKSPVDLLFNGGIGTYVKSATESHADVGDRTNEYCRVNGGELRCKVVGEGGNLGFTQLGRIEYALTGGLINTDFIDNSAGVDCSDHEVNLKILLDDEIHKGKLTLASRDKLLFSLTQEMADLVLHDNIAQAEVMSFAAFHSAHNIGLHISYIHELETLGVLNRALEFLPDDKKLLERKAAGIGLTRPELAVLLAYTKIHIKMELLKSPLPEDPFILHIVETAFPASLTKKYAKAMQAHLLHRDIIATQLSNQVVNEMGITFVYRMQLETGATVDEIVRAYSIASRIFGTAEVKALVMSLNYKVPINDQFQMLYNIRHLVNLSTRWFLHELRTKPNLENIIERYSTHIKSLESLVPELMSGTTKNYMQTLAEQFEKEGLPQATAFKIATFRAIYALLNIISVATEHKLDLPKTAHVYFKAGERINLLWFRDQIAMDSRSGHWNVLARLTLRDELDISQRALTAAIMKYNKKQLNPDEMIDQWIAANQRGLDRWHKLLATLNEGTVVDYTIFFITLRELSSLIVASQ